MTRFLEKTFIEQPQNSMTCPNARKGAQACSCAPPVKSKITARLIFGLAIVGAVLFVMANNLKSYEKESLDAQNLGMIAVLGFLTGLHCIGMCGGFMMSYIQQAKKAGMTSLEMHGRYAISKVFSYAMFGAAFGALGSLIHFSNSFKAAASLIGGFVLLYLGGRGLGLFRQLNRWKFSLQTERFSGPVGVGLMKGLMFSCGPLQALYLLAASQGSAIEGAKMLAVFGLSTLPVFLFYGSVVSTIAWFKSRWADILTSLIVILFGVMMISRGAALTGYDMNPFSGGSSEVHANDVFYADTQHLFMEVGKRGYSRKNIYFHPDKPICWEIYVHEITNCNKAIEIPEYHISRNLEMGQNFIEFLPGQEEIVFTCWMGMMKGRFKPFLQERDSLSLAHIIQN